MQKNQKREIRKNILDLRNALSPEDISHKSFIIIDRLKKLEKFQTSNLIMCYVDFGNEVKTRDLINTCLKLSKRIAVPLVARGENGVKELWVCEINDIDKDLEPGTYGILEPRMQQAKRLEPKEIDLVVVPGLAFDIKKQRIGYGAGYYDRLLKNTRTDCFKVGVAFDIQILESIPTEEHDVPLDLLISEKRII